MRYHRKLQLHLWASCTATVLKWALVIGALGWVGGFFAGMAAALAVATAARAVIGHVADEQLRRRLERYRAIDVDEIEGDR